MCIYYHQIHLNSNLGRLSFYEDESGNKYVVGADSVFPFTNEKSIILCIFHQMLNGTVYLPATLQIDIYTKNGIMNIVNTGSFSLEDSNKILCNKVGTLLILGCYEHQGGSPTVTIYKNGVEQTTKLIIPKYIMNLKLK